MASIESTSRSVSPTDSEETSTSIIGNVLAADTAGTSSTVQKQHASKNYTTESMQLAPPTGQHIDTAMSDESNDEEEEEETEEEEIQREIAELIQAAKDACRYIDNDDRHGRVQCMCVSGNACGTGQTVFRKVISDFFGRNKRNAQQIPEIYQVIWCRKHYQRGAYQNHKPSAKANSGKLASLGKITWIVVQLLLIEKWRPNCTYTIALSEKEKKRLKAANGGKPTQPKAPRGQGKTGRTNVKGDKDAPIEVVRSYQKHLGENKSLQDCLRTVNDMKYDVEEDITAYLPGVEFLAEVDDDFKVPRKGKKSSAVDKDDEDTPDGQGRSNNDHENDSENEGDNEENGGESDYTGNQSYGAPSGSHMSYSTQTPNLEVDKDYDDFSGQNTPTPLLCSGGRVFCDENPERFSIKHNFVADKKGCGYSLAQMRNNLSAGFTAVNEMEPNSPRYSPQESESEHGQNEREYHPDDPRNHIRREVMNMRATMLAQQGLIGPKSAAPPSPPNTHTPAHLTMSPVSAPRSRGSEASMSDGFFEKSSNAIRDLLKLRRFSKPIDPEPVDFSRSASPIAEMHSTPSMTQRPISPSSEVLPESEAKAVEGLLLLKRDHGLITHQLELQQNVADFRPSTVYDDYNVEPFPIAPKPVLSKDRSSFQLPRPSNAVSFSDGARPYPSSTDPSRFALGFTPGSRKRRHVSDEGDNTHSCRHDPHLPTERASKRIRIARPSLIDERSLYWE